MQTACRTQRTQRTLPIGLYLVYDGEGEGEGEGGGDGGIARAYAHVSIRKAGGACHRGCVGGQVESHHAAEQCSAVQCGVVLSTVQCTSTYRQLATVHCSYSR